MNLRRRKSRRARAADKLRGIGGGRSSLRKKVTRSGAGKTAEGAGMTVRAAGRSGKAMAVYTGRKAAGKRAPLLVSLPLFAGASVAGFFAVRKMRRGVKQSVPA